MHTSTLSAFLLSITAANAVTMTHWKASSDVPAGFQAYLEGVYAAAEDAAATTEFTDYFPAKGELSVLGNTAIGATEILALKQKLMPVAGYKTWNHLPTTVTVTSDTTTEAVYHVSGNIETTYTASTYNTFTGCSSAAYESEFTVLKTNGELDWTAQNGNLQWYNDISVVPDTTPTTIECTG